MEVIAELLAFVSGLLLLRPAWRINDNLRQSAQLREILVKSKSSLEHTIIPKIQERLAEATSSWNSADQFCLRVGVSLFVLSTLIKLFKILIHS